MSTNIIEKIAKLLNIEMYEEFKIRRFNVEVPYRTLYRFTPNGGLQYYCSDSKSWMIDKSEALNYLIIERWKIVKLPRTPKMDEAYYRPEKDLYEDSYSPKESFWINSLVDQVFLN